MRRLAFVAIGVVMLAGCGRQPQEQSSAGGDGALFDNATVNAILGPGLEPPGAESNEVNSAGPQENAAGPSKDDKSK